MMARPVILLLGLVIVPTALLSFLSGRALKDWETSLQGRFDINVARARREISTRLQDDLDTDWWAVHAAVEAALAPRGRWQDIEAAAAQLQQSAALVEQVIVFMDPLGFVYPRDVDSEPPEAHGTDADRDALTQQLRAAITDTPPHPSASRARIVPFEGTLYRFGPLRQGQGLHVGYRVRPEAFRRRLARTLETLSGGDFTLQAVNRLDPPPEDLRIEDSFAPARARPADETGPALLAATALPPPLDFIAVAAIPHDPHQAARAAAWRSKLDVWGIALLAGTVVLGASLLLRRGLAETHHAREQRNLLVGVSHDLRTPVAALKMLAESLYHERVRAPERQREFLRTLVTESDRLADMIERVLLLLRQDRKSMVFDMESLAPGDLVRAVVERYRERRRLMPSEHDHASLQLSVADGLPPVPGDRRALCAVLSNLLDNALTHGQPIRPEAQDAAPRLPVRIRVDCVGRRGRNRVCIAVRDYGRGIPRREKGRIFRRYYRGQNHAETPDGAGLGLALCRDILQAHGGWIEVRSRLNQGSEFRCYLRTTRKRPS